MNDSLVLFQRKSTEIIEKYGGLFSLLLGFLFVYALFGQVLFSPNDYLFTNSGDGIKNYYTYMYQLRYGVDYNHFSGMLYPYGDLFVMTDGNPLLAWILMSLRGLFPSLPFYGVGILNSLILFSFIVTPLIVYKLLKTFELPAWYALLFAFAIAILSPQIGRMYGHLSLAFTFYIPLLLLFLRKEYLHHSWYYLFGLFCLLLFGYFTHPYLGVMGSIVVVLFFFLKWIFKESPLNYGRKNSFFLLLKRLSAGLVPLGVFQWYISSIDKVMNRPQMKFSYGEAFGQLQSVLFSPKSDFFHFFQSIFGISNQKWEALSYVGSVFLAIGFVLLSRWIIKKIQKKKIDADLMILASTGIFILLFALGFPFRFFPKNWLDMMPEIRQIRVTARFEWIFYYIINAVIVVSLYRWSLTWKKRRRQLLLPLLGILAIGFNGYDTIHKNYTGKTILKQKNPFKIENLSQTMRSELKLVTHGTKAILVVPFFIIGGENISIDLAAEKAVRDAFLLSYHSGLPLLNSCMSRTSESKVAEKTAMLAPYFGQFDTVLTSYLKDTVLVINYPKLCTWQDAYLTQQLQPYFHSHDSFLSASIPIESLYQNQRNQFAKQFAGIDNSWVQNGIVFSQDSSLTLFETYDISGNDTLQYFRGGRGKSGKTAAYNLLYTIPPDRLEEDKKYWVSFWYYANMSITNNCMFFTKVTNRKGKKEWTNVDDTRMGCRLLGNWKYVKFPLTVSNSSSETKICLHSYRFSNPIIYFDQFLLWEQGKNVFYKYKGEIYRNNYPFKRIFN